jgi:2'-5' RNA ligase
VYSLNAPVPPEIARLAIDLASDLPGADPRTRGEHTLLVKRLGTDGEGDLDHRIERVRETLRGVAPFEVRITGVDWFPEPETGTGPVVYLAVESPALAEVHRALCEVIDPVAHLEGEEYVPHVTIARGGDREEAERLTQRDVDSRTYTVDELAVWDAHRDVATTRFSLPV